MLKYKLNRKLITVICDKCNNIYEKPISEYNRNIKLNRRNYCSRKCCLSNADKTRTNRFDITNFSNNKRDKYTPYRYLYRSAKSRYKEFTLTLDDLINQWINQNGICVYSGINLILPENKTLIHPIFRASLDRIDSNKGYHKDNIQFVSTSINLMKSNLSHKETIELCKLIAKNYY